MWRNTLTINGVLKKNITKLNFQPAQYGKNKFNKDNFGEKINKKMWRNTAARKNYVGKHCSNPQCFFLKKKLQS